MTDVIYMVDSIASPATTGSAIPDAILKAPAAAGYLHGNSWPDYQPYAQARPDLVKVGRLVSITLTASASARCLDIERGGAVTSQAPGWFRGLADRSAGKPIIYTSASNVSNLIATMTAAGIARSSYLIWSAHYTYTAHICSPATCGFPQSDGTQYTDRVAGNCDGSVMFTYCFQPSIPIPPVPEDTMSISAVQNGKGLIEVFVEKNDGAVFHTWQNAGGTWTGSKKGVIAVWHPLGKPGA